jgi:O-antigen/teichoic acid export membrane protein
MALGLVRGLLMARILGPTGWGIFGGARLVASYLSNAHLGVLHGMNRLMPLRLGAGDRQQAQNLQNTGFCVCVALAALCAVALLVFAVLSGGRYDPDTRLGLILVAGIVIAAQGVTLYASLLRTFDRFGLIAKQVALSAVAEFVLLIGLAKLFGFLGALAGLLAATAGAFWYLVWRSSLRLSLRLRRTELGLLLRAGAPLLVLVFANQVLRTVDQVLVLHLRHATDFGVYRLGALMAGALYNLPAAVGYVVFPSILQAYGEGGTPESIRRQFALPTIALAGLTPILAGVAALLMPLLVATVLRPEYLVGVPTMRVLLLGATVLALPVTAGNFLVAVNRERHLIGYNVLGAGVVAAGTVLAVRGGHNVEDLLLRVAAGACIGYLVSGVLVLSDVLAHYERSAWGVARQVLGFHLPTAYCVAAAWLSHHVVSAAFGAHLGVWCNVPEALGFIVLTLPLLWHTNQRSGVLGVLTALLRRRG